MKPKEYKVSSAQEDLPTLDIDGKKMTYENTY
jgi:hypothetical protein